MEPDHQPQNVILSGIRATGRLHIGNYLGAIRYFADLAADPENLCLFFVADLHSLTTAREDLVTMREQTIDIVRWYLAAGIDPDKHIIFCQSAVPATSELNWLLSCVSPYGDLTRMPHWKEKAQAESDKDRAASAGLFTYPVLMAADILGPGATIVPVGEDQHPHVEFARDLARRFNTWVGEDIFPVPDLMERAIRVPGLKGMGKMGKSEPKGTINLDEDDKTIRKKIMKADKKLPPSSQHPDPQEPRIGDAPGDPMACRVYRLHEIISEADNADLKIREGCKAGTLRCGDCKQALHANTMRMLGPMQQRYHQILARGDDYILDILRDGARRASERITPRVERAKERLNLWRHDE